MLQAIRSKFGWKKQRPQVKKITLGICAMDRKAKSKPMKEILGRLPPELFEIIIFGDETILDQPVEQWPVVEVLIAFYSTKFPTEKASAYIKLRNPFIFNNLTMETVMKDRRKVYDLLKSINVDVPNHVYLNRDDPSVENFVEEFDEYVIINGVQINKPLVEKPVDAEDHNIYIYYPMSAGGGSKRLFRKVENCSSMFHPEINELRTEGSYIYEEFLHTQGTDVKVYTVGPDYGHAEARKSPVVDGKVNRDSSGYEVRYPVILTPREKDIARNIVEAFQQYVCGFDILRVQGKSYVCDVNGFSFVKNSRKYYDDASQILMEHMLAALRPEYQSSISTRAPLLFERERAGSQPQLSHRASFSTDAEHSTSVNEDIGRSSPNLSQSQHGDNISVNSDASSILKKTTRFDEEELRCVIAVVRHGDRTPKQKMKVKISEPVYLEYYHSYTKSPYKDLKVKSKSALVKFLNITRDIIESGKIEVKLLKKLRQMKDVLERWEISGFNRKLQMKPQKWTSDSQDNVPESNVEATEILVILKWGGDLTPLGRQQAEKLGETFRQELYPQTEGGGVLRLHSTYRHDLKIKASDEGRVMKTAAAFTKGLLELEGPLTPILVSLVTVEEKNRLMLDRGGNNEVRDDMDHCKKHLDKLQVDQEMTLELARLIAPGAPQSLIRAMMNLKNPLKTLWRIYELIESLCNQLDEYIKDYSDTSESPSPAATDFDLNYAPALVHSPSKENLMMRLDTFSKDESSQNNSPEKVSMVKKLSTYEVSKNVIQEAAEILSSSWPKASDIPLSNSEVSELTSQAMSDIRDEGIINQDCRIETPINMTATTTLTRGDSEQSISTNSQVTFKTIEIETKSPEEGLYLSETFTLMSDRWQKLYKDFYSSATNMFDLTKVPDVYDMIRYDCLHNHHIKLDAMEELFELSQHFENSVVPQEYGIDKNEKRVIGSKMCGALIEKIKQDLTAVYSNHEMAYSLDHSHGADLAINSLGRLVRTRLYFTSESHLHTLLNVLRYPSDGKACAFSPEGLKLLDETQELSYLTQVIIRLFEDRIDPSKFRCEILLSPGANTNPLKDKSGEVAPYVILNRSITCDDLMMCLDNAIDEAKICEPEEVRDTVDPIHIDLSHSVEEDVIHTSDVVAFSSPDILSTEHIPVDHRVSSEKDSHGLHALHPLKRNISMTVVCNSGLENNNSWEVSQSLAPSSMPGHYGRHRSRSSMTKRADFIKEVVTTTTRSKPTLALNSTLRSQSPAPALMATNVNTAGMSAPSMTTSATKNKSPRNSEIS